MKVELNEKQLEILATYTPKATPKKYTSPGIIGMGLMIIGAFIFMGKGLIIGISIAAVGLIFVGIYTIMISRFARKAKQELLDYIKKNGTLPPEPEKQ